MTTPVFPRALLAEKSHSWNLVGVAATPGVTAASVATIIRSDGGGFWQASMLDVQLGLGKNLVGKERIRVTTLLWRAVRQVCNGGVNAMVVWRNDTLFRPWPFGVAQGIGGAGAGIPHDDDALFDDGAGYSQSIINISAAAAPLRATALGITITYAGALQGGECFSINHPTMGWRLYEIATVNMLTPATAIITFHPPLREAITDGTVLEFDRPRCVMRLGSPSSMNLSIVPWTFNQASVDWVETFPP
jgi:hypothetical protein